MARDTKCVSDVLTTFDVFCDLLLTERGSIWNNKETKQCYDVISKNQSNCENNSSYCTVSSQHLVITKPSIERGYIVNGLNSGMPVVAVWKKAIAGERRSFRQPECNKSKSYKQPNKISSVTIKGSFQATLTLTGRISIKAMCMWRCVGWSREEQKGMAQWRAVKCPSWVRPCI